MINKDTYKYPTTISHNGTCYYVKSYKELIKIIEKYK